MTRDTIWESDKNTGKLESKEARPYPAGDHKYAMNRHDQDEHETQIHVTKKIHKRISALQRSVRKLLEGLNTFDGTTLTIISDVDQDKYIFGSHETFLSDRCIISTLNIT